MSLPKGVPEANWFTKIIQSVVTPLGFLVLLVLILFLLALAGSLGGSGASTDQRWILGLLALIITGFFVLLFCSPHVLQLTKDTEPIDPDSFADPSSSDDSELFVEAPPISGNWPSILGSDQPAPPVTTWNYQLRPALYQASYYSIPTYYLDRDLYIIDFNTAFEIIFRSITGKLRGRHVNWFIKALANREDVFHEGKLFTEEVERKKVFPYVHMEPIVYVSDDFGRVEFTKIASQLHDSHGRLRGWAVALMPRSIKWEDFESSLFKKLSQDKLWSIYSGPYDHILPKFEPYNELIEEVISVVPAGQLTVGDFGAGTGNVTKKLAAKNHRVVAIENSLGMLQRLTQKVSDYPTVQIVKASIEDLSFLSDQSLDAAVMVNVLYALDDPIGCLREIHRLLRPDGLIGVSTTHRGTNLDELLEAIKEDVEIRPDRDELSADYALLEQVNRAIESSIARRHSRDDYRKFFEQAGFEIVRITDSTYHSAVMTIHAKRKS